MNEPVTPGLIDELAFDELADSEVHVETVTGLVPLGNPHVRQWSTAQSRTKVAKEDRDIITQLVNIVTPLTGIGESAETVQAVGSAVAAQACTSTPSRLERGALRVRGGTSSNVLTDRLDCRDEAPAPLEGLRVQGQTPTQLALGRLSGQRDTFRTDRQGHASITPQESRDASKRESILNRLTWVSMGGRPYKDSEGRVSFKCLC